MCNCAMHISICVRGNMHTNLLGCVHFDMCFCVPMNVSVSFPYLCACVPMCPVSYNKTKKNHKIPSKGSSELGGERQDLHHLLSAVPCDEAGEAAV